MELLQWQSLWQLVDGSWCLEHGHVVHIVCVGMSFSSITGFHLYQLEIVLPQQRTKVNRLSVKLAERVRPVLGGNNDGGRQNRWKDCYVDAVFHISVSEYIRSRAMHVS
jgi:hypothetical protein